MNRRDLIRFYLSSLALNPRAEHLWTFVHSAVINLSSDQIRRGSAGSSGSDSGPNDLEWTTKFLQAVSARDLPACRTFISGVLEGNDQLPSRSLELEAPVDTILADLPEGSGFSGGGSGLAGAGVR